MAEGVTFTDGEQVSGMATGSQASAMNCASGGPMETPTDDKGRSCDVMVGNNENMPASGNSLVSPTDD